MTTTDAAMSIDVLAQRAPASVATTREVVVTADVGEVWQVLADFGGISGWAPNVDHSCLMSDRVEGVGASRRVQVGRSTLVERVVEWEGPRSLAYSLEGMPPVIRSVVNAWRIEPRAGATHVSLTSSVDAGSRPLRKLIAKVVGRRLATASEQMLDGLEQHLRQVSR